MNGRIYDPKLGRFLQADPLIQDLSNPQSLNRYSYVFNNPLAFTDPTGYSAFSKYLRPILAIGAAYFTGGWASSLYTAGNTAGALAVSVGGGALVGAIATGSGKGALIGAFTGAAAFGVGSSIAGGGSNGISNAMALAGAQSLAGGLQGQVNHGNFGAGFMSGFSVEWEFGNLQMVGGQGAGPIRDNETSAIEVGGSRPLTEDEIVLANEVFGDAIDYSQPLVFKRKYIAFQPRGMAIAPNGNIYFHPDDYVDDFSKLGLGRRAWFIHELTHVYQSQQGKNVAIRGFFSRKYNYTLERGKPFSKYRIEQQGEIMSDYYHLLNDSAGGPAMDIYRSILPFKK